jgi:hypothetical protein
MCSDEVEVGVSLIYYNLVDLHSYNFSMPSMPSMLSHSCICIFLFIEAFFLFRKAINFLKFGFFSLHPCWINFSVRSGSAHCLKCKFFSAQRIVSKFGNTNSVWGTCLENHSSCWCQKIQRHSYCLEVHIFFIPRDIWSYIVL